MALEDKFVEEDVQELDATFDRIEHEFEMAHQRRVVDWERDLNDIFDD